MKINKVRVTAAVCLLIIFFLIIRAHLFLYRYGSDDAYIHFRIANNFVEHGVPYYNLNEPIMTTSSPAWILLLSVFILLGKMLQVSIDTYLPITVALFNSCMIVLGAAAYTQLLNRLRDSKKNIIVSGIFFFFILQ